MLKWPTQSKVNFHFLHKRFSLSKRNQLKEFIRDLFRKQKKKLRSLNYIFCTDSYLLQINREFRSHDDYTDILSFDLSENPSVLDGEIYISIDRVKENARLYKSSFNKELHRVIFHGALHFCGFKDQKKHEKEKMRRMEDGCLQLYREYIK